MKHLNQKDIAKFCASATAYLRVSLLWDSWTALCWKMELICCPEISVTNYQSTTHNIPYERKPQ